MMFDKRYSVLFEDSQVRCYWKDKPFNCAEAFMNRISDSGGACFTFNPGKAESLITLNNNLSMYWYGTLTFGNKQFLETKYYVFGYSEFSKYHKKSCYS